MRKQGYIVEDEKIRIFENGPPLRFYDADGKPLYLEEIFYQNIPCIGWDEIPQEPENQGQGSKALIKFEKGESSSSNSLKRKYGNEMAIAEALSAEYTPFQLLVQNLAFKQFAQGLSPWSQENLHLAEGFRDSFF